VPVKFALSSLSESRSMSQHDFVANEKALNLGQNENLNFRIVPRKFAANVQSQFAIVCRSEILLHAEAVHRDSRVFMNFLGILCASDAWKFGANWN
jgi:hypothetical protein